MSRESKESYILSRLRADPLAVDIQLSCFHSALHNYRHDTVLRPFPPGYSPDVDDASQRDYVALKKDIEAIKKVTNFTADIAKTYDSSVIDLVHWILEAKKFKLKTCSKDKFSVIEALTGQMMPVPPPNYVFEVVYNNSIEDKFHERKGDKDLFYAYHGSRMENFYSILNHGLQQNMTKNALFGEGIYLSGELSVSLPYSPTGSGWSNSIIGQKLSCIAVCEIIDDPTGVKCQEKDDKAEVNGMSRRKSRSHIAGSMGGEIPDKYYVVRNNELLRTKYLLVYAEKSKTKSLQQSWMYQHKFTVMVIFYALILLMVGLYNSKSFHILLKKLLKKSS